MILLEALQPRPGTSLQTLPKRYNLYTMSRFEYDPSKSLANLEKHGIGAKGGKLWSAVITYRKGVIRILSVRRARKSEVTLYES